VLAWTYLLLGAGVGMEMMDMGGGRMMAMAPERDAASQRRGMQFADHLVTISLIDLKNSTFGRIPPRQVPCHHTLAEALRAYIDAAGIVEDRKGWLFRTARGHKADTLSDRPMNQSNAWCMIRRRAKAAGIAAEIGCHTFRATGITAYLANGGALEHAREMAAHERPRTTKLYDRTKERLTQDEVERIRL
jgi:integrase